MARRLLDYDHFTGLITWHDYDEATETTILTHQQDVTDIVDACKRDNNHSSASGEQWHVASIPAVVQMEWMTRYGVDALSNDPDQKRRVARLLDGDYKHLKRLPITIGGY